METKKQPDLETKLTGLMDQFSSTLRESKLVVNPRIEGLTLYYQQRRGMEGICSAVKAGIGVILSKYSQTSNNFAEISFGIADNLFYSARLEIVSSETEEEKRQIAEKEAAYEVLSRINNFISAYNQGRKRR